MNKTAFIAFMGFVALLAVSLAACDSDDDSNANSDSGTHEDASTQADAGDASAGDAGTADCVEHPTTHVEIINACTDAEALDKNPKLPLLLSDGGLPPLP